MFIKNSWYVACRPDEIYGKPLGRQICGEKMVLYRGAEGQPVVLEDFCPHRGTPLSLGFVKDGNLVCGYHGLEMGCEGKTVAMPGQRVSSFPPIRTFPVIERYGFIWVWPGDHDKADPALMPTFEFFDNPQWAYGGGMYHVKAGYELMIDNLMDLSHETYVHSTSIGQPEIDETPCKTVTEGNRVITSRFMENIKAPPFWRMAMRANGLNDEASVDRWQICRFTPPSHVMIDVGVALAGKGGFDAADEDKVYCVVVDFITPESDTSHWYFWGMARKFKPNDPALTYSIREGQGKIFGEDMQMLEQQQANLLNYPSRRLLKLNIDAGGVHSRMIIERLLAEQSNTSDVHA